MINFFVQNYIGELPRDYAMSNASQIIFKS